MRFIEFGDKINPKILLIHGYGVSWKMWKSQIDILQKDYQIILPVLDGHDEENEQNEHAVDQRRDVDAGLVLLGCRFTKTPHGCLLINELDARYPTARRPRPPTPRSAGALRGRGPEWRPSPDAPEKPCIDRAYEPGGTGRTSRATRSPAPSRS